MGKYIIEYKRDLCIGAAACVAVKPETWELASDGKADIIGGKKVNENFETYEFNGDEEELRKQIDAAQVCPVNAIKIKNKETGQYLI